MLRRLCLVAFSVVVLAMLQVAIRGQSSPTPTPTTGVTISGSVVDASLSPLGGVTITLSIGTRSYGRTTTGADGAFRFPSVAPGTYRVQAEATGFPSFVRDLHVRADTRSIQLPIVLARPEDAMPTSTSDAGAVGGGIIPAPSAASSAAPPAQRESPAGNGRSTNSAASAPVASAAGRVEMAGAPHERWDYQPDARIERGEGYAHVDANQFRRTREHPLSTFGADVDTASYSNVRRFLSSGRLPPSDAVRVEEMVNYFRFGYAEPRGTHPLALTTEVGDCPWAPSHKLVLIGARARASAGRQIEGRNIVLLIDVSGSMASAERLPMIKTALQLFVDTMDPDDRLAIVTYAGTSGIRLPSTPARRRDVILDAIASLSAGGSTNGAQGLVMAYRTAREAFIPGGVNRVILATDGDFNVGITNQQDLVRLIERERQSGVFLSVFGVGSGNLKDATMERLADHGNGHYAYLDSLQEARRVLIREADTTLETVAKDVKFQVEFNPAMVRAWKLIGYENRGLAARDFNNDRKDGGEMGAGHTVTVLYEVVPVGADVSDGDHGEDRPDIDPLRYQPAPRVEAAPVVKLSNSGEWLTVKARYKRPEGEVSDLIAQPVRSGGRVVHLPFASAVAEFGLLLRDDASETGRWDALTRRVDRLVVPAGLAADKAAFGELVATARGLARTR